MEAEGDGVLDNLPSSRPGRRSEKRSSGARGGKRAAGRPAASTRRAAEDAERRGAAAAVTPGDETPPPAPSPDPSEKGGRPIGDAVRAAAQLTGAPLRIGVIVTREVLRRLPRP
jgi:hypothetical protein